MNSPTTYELIKENESYFDDDSGSDDENFCRGRLQGRLDVLEKLHNDYHSCKSCGRRSHIDCEEKRLDKFTCSMGREIKNIRDALQKGDEQ